MEETIGKVDRSKWAKLDVHKLTFRSDGDPGDFISCDETKCNGCGQCVLVCGPNLWSLSKEGKARLSSQYKKHCLECAGCWAICEQEAIDFKYPKAGTGISIKYG